MATSSLPTGYRLYPSTAYWLSIIGGVLIVLFGLTEVVVGITLRSTLESEIPGLSGLVVILGALGALVGFVIVVLGFRLKSSPGTTRTTGILIIVLSLVSYVGGGGLFLGLILAFLGGILAWLWRPPQFPQTMYGFAGYNAPIRQVPGPLPWQTSPSAPPPGVSQRLCASCGGPNVVNAQFCAKCGAPLPSA